MLDYTADADTLGKNLGDDLAEGKATLPVIHCMNHCDSELRGRIAQAIETGDLQAMPEIVNAIHTHGSLDYSRKVAETYAARAAEALQTCPPSPYRDALLGLARYAMDRNH